METLVDRQLEQVPLLDLTGREFNLMWVDEKAPLFIANNPLHWKAHKLQILAARLEKQLERNPAQFNSKTYMDVIDQLGQCMKEINEHDTVLDERELDSSRAKSGETPPVGKGTTTSVDSGISADNPLSGEGLHNTGTVPVPTGLHTVPRHVPGDQ